MDGEAEIVKRVNIPLRTRRQFAATLYIGHRRDRQPVLTQRVGREITAERFFDVIRRNAVPNDVCRITGDVIENSSVDLQIVRERKKADAGADTVPDNADLFVALLLQPFDGAASVDDSLPKRLQSPPDIRSDKIIGAVCLGRTLQSLR